MTQSAIATAADYADAMLTARRARRFLLGLLMMMLVIQLAVFFVARYARSVPLIPAAAAPFSAPVTTTHPTTMMVEAAKASRWGDGQYLRLALQWVTELINFFSIGLAFLLCVVLLVIVGIMLVGRLIGVSRVLSAFFWCVVLTLLLFPWQAFLNFPDMADATFRLPGVLYTWSELVQDARFDYDLYGNILKWARFVGFPVLALLLLLVIKSKSRRGLKLALGEVSLDGPVTSSTF